MKFGLLLYRGLFGVRTISGGLETIVKLAEKAEELDYDSIWVTDESWWTPDPITYATILTERTRKITIGILGMNPYVRHPLSLALSFHTFGEIAGKRAIAGVCAGSEARLRKLGLNRVNPLVAVSETIELMRRLVRERPLDYQGQYVRVRGVSTQWIKRDLKVYICANGPRMLELAGRVADGIVLAHLPPNYARWGLRFVQKGLADARKKKLFDYCVQPIAFISKIRAKAISSAKSYLPFLPPPIALAKPRILAECGFTADEVSSINTAYHEAFSNPVKMPTEIVEKIVRFFAITGTPEEALEKVREYKKAGVTHIIVGFTPEENIAERLRYFKKYIIDRL